ncbi:MAG: hypothetical protein H0T77_04865 [Pyrinomonadaceae bacterium]|nr:hypothetical protein [Pyrinomonadaceae bacterium]
MCWSVSNYHGYVEPRGLALSCLRCGHWCSGSLYGEEVAAFIVLKDGATATKEEFVEFCRERLADYKCPDGAASKRNS